MSLCGAPGIFPGAFFVGDKSNIILPLRRRVAWVVEVVKVEIM